MDTIDINIDLIKSLEIIIPIQHEKLIRIICKDMDWDKKEIVEYLMKLGK
jgi:hypothetical protein